LISRLSTLISTSPSGSEFGDWTVANAESEPQV
jgi:hypothetical protein